VSAEQESHAFLFGVRMPDLSSFSEADRQRCLDRAREAFNQLLFPGDGWPNDPGKIVDISRDQGGPGQMPLGRLRIQLDQHGAEGQPLIVVMSGQTAGMSQPCTSPLPDREIGQRVVNLYTLCFSHPSVRGIIWTGFTDREANAPGHGLLRDDLAPKAAFQMLRKLIGTVWHTRAAGATDAMGQFRFRGFYGGYRVVAASAGETATVGHFTLSHQDASPWALGIASN